LEDVSDRLNSLFSASTQGEAATRSVWTPAVNVEETQEELLLSAEIPGMGIEDVEISAHFKDGILHIQMPKAPEAKSRKISIKAEG